MQNVLILCLYVLIAFPALANSVLTPNGSVITLTNMAINKFTPDGKLDPSFKVTQIRNSQFIALQPNGKILVLANDSQLLRLHSDGSIDKTFTTNLSFKAKSLAVQPDGKIIAVGRKSQILMAVVGKFKADGQLDFTFGKFGLYNHPIQSEANTVTLQGDGKILIGGQVKLKASIMRLTADGNLDNSFGNGTGITTDSKLTSISKIIEQDDGRILAASYWNRKILRFFEDGLADNSFNSIQLPYDFIFNDFAIQDNGKIIAVGGKIVSNTTNRTNAALIKLTHEGLLDKEYNSTGFLVEDHGCKLMNQANGKQVKVCNSNSYDTVFPKAYNLILPVAVLYRDPVLVIRQ